MRKILGLVVLLLAGYGVNSQEAKVIALDSWDADQAHGAYMRLLAARKDWDDAQDRIIERYLRVGYGDPEAGMEAYSPVITNNGITWSLSDHITQKDLDKEVNRQKKASYHRKGWENGFVFSGDFKFIVPKPPGFVYDGIDGHCLATDAINNLIPAPCGPRSILLPNLPNGIIAVH
jgi:hypothetical protein